MDNLYQDFDQNFDDPSVSTHGAGSPDDSGEGFTVRMEPSKPLNHSRPFPSSLPKTEPGPTEKYCKKAKTVPCPICNYQFSRSQLQEMLSKMDELERTDSSLKVLIKVSNNQDERSRPTLQGYPSQIPHDIPDRASDGSSSDDDGSSSVELVSSNSDQEENSKNQSQRIVKQRLPTTGNRRVRQRGPAKPKNEDATPTKRSGPHVCNACGLELKTTNSLNRHMSDVHLKHKGFQCDECGDKFTRIDGLSRHVKAKHLQIRPHECGHCEKSFALAHNLKAHIKTVHQKIKNHVCESCGYKCFRKDTMDVHKRKHGHSNPFSENL